MSPMRTPACEALYSPWMICGSVKAFSFAMPNYQTYRSVTRVFGTAPMRPWQFIESIFDFAAGPGLRPPRGSRERAATPYGWTRAPRFAPFDAWARGATPDPRASPVTRWRTTTDFGPFEYDW